MCYTDIYFHLPSHQPSQAQHVVCCSRTSRSRSTSSRKNKNVKRPIWELPKLRGTLFWTPSKKDPTILSAILGSPIFGTPPFDDRASGMGSSWTRTFVAKPVWHEVLRTSVMLSQGADCLIQYARRKNRPLPAQSRSSAIDWQCIRVAEAQHVSTLSQGARAAHESIPGTESQGPEVATSSSDQTHVPTSCCPCASGMHAYSTSPS